LDHFSRALNQCAGREDELSLANDGVHAVGKAVVYAIKPELLDDMPGVIQVREVNSGKQGRQCLQRRLDTVRIPNRLALFAVENIRINLKRRDRAWCLKKGI
jgi:hypothetical protein